MKRPLLYLMALGAAACLSASASASHLPAQVDLASDATVIALAPVAAPIQLAQHCYPPQYRGHHHHHGPGYGYGYGGYGRGYRPARYQYYRGGPVGYRSYGYSNSLYGYGPGLNVGRGGGFSLYIGF